MASNLNHIEWVMSTKYAEKWAQSQEYGEPIDGRDDNMYSTLYICELGTRGANT
jgi:hypothetical protein